MEKKLFSALHRHELNVIKDIIVNEGCCVNLRFGDGSTPLHIAAEKGYIDVIKLLISVHASLDLKNRHGQPALVLGVHHHKVVDTLVVAGAQVNLSDPQGRTALHMACSKGLISAVTCLTAAGASVNDLDKWGRTPLHVTLLNITHNQRVTPSYTRVVTVLIQKGAKMNHRDKQQSTPLFLAVAPGDSCLGIVKMLVSHGAKPDLQSRHKLTPLMLTIMKGYEKICMFLLSLNCDVNLKIAATKNSCFRTALRKGYAKLAKLILASGCKIHEETWLNSAWDIAIQNQDDEILDWLSDIRSNPQTLRQMSRSAFRQSWGTDLHSVVMTLHYPETLKSYILLEDILPSNICKFPGFNTSRR